MSSQYGALQTFAEISAALILSFLKLLDDAFGIASP